MPYTLHQMDEEADVAVYQAYLRAQTETDLLDIVRHLSPDRYPARLDAAQRELRRRHVMHLPGYTSAEYNVRFLSVVALALSAATLLLSVLLGEGDALSLAGHSGAVLEDGMRVSRIINLMMLVVLQTVVTVGIRLGLYPLLLGILAWWTVSRGFSVRRHRARADVWRLAMGACLVLLLSTLVACGPTSALPDLFSSVHPRGLTLFDPLALFAGIP